MHTTVEAIYDDGRLYFDEKPKVKKARVLITFIQEINDKTKNKIKFPTKKLGKIKNIERESLYGEYLSD